LMRHLLARQCERLGIPAAPGHGDDYFAAQAAVIGELKARLAERYGALDDDLVRAQFQLRRAMRERAAADPDGGRHGRAPRVELQRLAGFEPALYGGARLEQERIAEVLKRTRSSLLTRGLGNALHNTVPIAAGPRTVHVRCAEPIAVSPAGADGAG